MQIVKDDQTTVEESEVDYQRFFADPKFIHYVGMLNPLRPGVPDCFHTLEFQYYKPRTARNHLYILRLLEWCDMLWGIVSIPIEEKHLMERAAKVNGLRVVDGVPTLFDGGVHHFPVSNSRIFTLENVPGHPVYKRPFC